MNLYEYKWNAVVWLRFYKLFYFIYFMSYVILSLREKCLSLEFFLSLFSSDLNWMRRSTLWISLFSLHEGKYGPENFRIRTLFTQCTMLLRIFPDSHSASIVSINIIHRGQTSRNKKNWVLGNFENIRVVLNINVTSANNATKIL